MGIGMVIWGSYGEVLATLQSPKCNVIDLVVAESFAALWAVIFAKEMGRLKIHFERDALQVVMALRQEGKNWCCFGKIINDIRIVLHSLQHWEVSHVRHETNEVAHRFAISVVDDVIHIKMPLRGF
ncbi:hypothetical protein SLA2020_442640 [Shorea laevis]